MAGPSFQDAQLILEFANWRHAHGVDDALAWMWSSEFVPDYEEFTKKYPRLSQGRRNANKICGYFDTIGLFYKHGLFNEDLLFDWIGFARIWNRIKGFALGARAEQGDPPLWQHFEELAVASAARASKQQ